MAGVGYLDPDFRAVFDWRVECIKRQDILPAYDDSPSALAYSELIYFRGKYLRLLFICHLKKPPE